MSAPHTQKVLSALRANNGDVTAQPPFPFSSWLRCLVEYDLDPGASSDVPVVGNREINQARDALEENLTIAYDEIDLLYSVVGDIGYSVTLTNADGLTVAEKADRCSAYYARQDKPGSIWSERYAGTNGVGTCLREARITSVYLDEHYFSEFIDMSCAAIPLFAPDGSLWAALNVSTQNPDLSPETHALALAVVRSSAERLSEAIFRNQFRDQTIVKLWQPDGRPCLLAVDDDQTVSGADVAARRMLEIPTTNFSPFSLWRLFAEDRKALQQRRDAPAPLEFLRLDNGHTVRGVASPAPPKRISVSVQARPRPLAGQPSEQQITMDGWAGGDPSMIESVSILRRLSHTRLPVLILGETGVGKDTLARGYHAESPRAAKPFVALNCAAVPESLIESELFGYASGAFTGARKEGSAGRFVQAHGGTLFLDEIGDMPLQLQTRLLRVLESGEVSPLGSGRTERVDVQFIAATNQKLEQRVADGAFREDLYYRLAGVVIEVPALRERADMAAVIDSCVERVTSRQNVRISEAARAMLHAHVWPGNLRELYLVVGRAASLATGGVIQPRDLLLRNALTTAPRIQGYAPPRPAPALDVVPTIKARVDEAERAAIVDAIRACGGDVAAAAQTLGMSRATLYRRIKGHGLSRRS
ncbi:sigma-54-dependent Fis family transcriptional regulator [Hansschlegelia plantiphila]|nr:sigma-54-dependent Fis family transcriptional regulator [Hansschlegelia plantiphila]